MTVWVPPSPMGVENLVMVFPDVDPTVPPESVSVLPLTVLSLVCEKHVLEGFESAVISTAKAAPWTLFFDRTLFDAAARSTHAVDDHRPVTELLDAVTRDVSSMLIAANPEEGTDTVL
ncbi:MAG TPA: hypothetical protein VII76_16385 [Acidimicrobiales bacterium]